LDEFYEEIDFREGFLQDILREDGLLSLEWQFNNDSSVGRITSSEEKVVFEFSS